MLLAETPAMYTHVSGGSGHDVYVHFCGDCGCLLYLTLGRWPGTLNIASGAFDDPDWLEITPENTQYLFTDLAQKGTIIPAGYSYYPAHCVTLDGAGLPPKVSDRPVVL